MIPGCARPILTLLLLAALLAPPAAGGTPWERAVAGDVNSGPWPPPPRRVAWRAPGRSDAPVTRLKILGFNDFHGNLESPTPASARQAGGAAVLASYLAAAQRGWEGRTLILHAGDLVGASPPISRLLRDEPAIEFLNLIAGPACRAGATLRDSRCNVVGTPGNHEFDRGPQELLRLLGVVRPGDGPGGGPPGFDGSHVPYVCANVFERRTGRTLLAPYRVVRIAGLPVGVIGAVLQGTPMTAPLGAVTELEFRDEAEAINAAARELGAQGVHAIVVLIHQGLYTLPTTHGLDWRGPLAAIVARLDGDVDVVISGHTHGYSNLLLPNAAGRPVLVTQAYAYGLAYSDIELEVDRRTHDMVAKSAIIVPTWADAGPGRHPDARVRELVERASRRVAPQISRVLAVAAAPITRASDEGGESALGDLVADAEREALHADLSLINAGGMRVDLDAGPITFGRVLALHPYGNRLLTLELGARELRQTLEQQWPQDPAAPPRILKIAGFSYLWDPGRPRGSHVVAMCDERGAPLDPERRYRVAVNDYLAGGGDGFDVLKARAVAGAPGPTDAEALAQFLAASHAALEPRIEGRIARADHPAGARCRYTSGTQVPAGEAP